MDSNDSFSSSLNMVIEPGQVKACLHEAGFFLSRDTFRHSQDQ
jgi:hypothetical protein